MVITRKGGLKTGILLVNGSFHKDGNTTQTLRIVEKAILEKGLETLTA